MTDAAYDWSQFHSRMYYLAPMNEVFRRFATPDGLQSFFIYRAQHRSAEGIPRPGDAIVQAGDRYDWDYVHDYSHGGVFEAVEPNRYLRFSFGAMTVEIHFRELAEAIEVDLHQTNCATEDPERAWQHLNCRSCWIYFLTNLRSILAGGPDVRDFDHPQWNDSVGIGFHPEAGPGAPRVKAAETT